MGHFLGPDDQHHSESSVFIASSLGQYIMNGYVCTHSTVVLCIICKVAKIIVYSLTVALTNMKLGGEMKLCDLTNNIVFKSM